MGTGGHPQSEVTPLLLCMTLTALAAQGCCKNNSEQLLAQTSLTGLQELNHLGSSLVVTPKRTLVAGLVLAKASYSHSIHIVLCTWHSSPPTFSRNILHFRKKVTGQ